MYREDRISGPKMESTSTLKQKLKQGIFSDFFDVCMCMWEGLGGGSGVLATKLAKIGLGPGHPRNLAEKK